jgi:hypothetical protein
MSKEIPTLTRDYTGSIGLYSPTFNRILKDYRGDNPHTGNHVRLYNFSDVMEHRLFDLRNYYSMEDEEVVFVPEEEAKLFLTKNKISDDDPEIEAKKNEIDEAVQPHKIDGRRIEIVTKGDVSNWIIPGKRETIKVLKTAFDVAAAAKCHVAVEIQPYSFETTMKVYRAMRPVSSQSQFSLRGAKYD